MAQAEAMSRTQGSEITRAMEEQKELEQRFESLVAARAVLRTMPNKNKLKEVGCGHSLTGPTYSRVARSVVRMVEQA